MVATQRGWRVSRWGSPPEWGEFARPEPAAGEVLVQVEACGVGRTVLNCINGDLADDDRLLPRVPGHELVGRVVSAGPGVTSGLVGRRVTAYFYLVCGHCRWCSRGWHARCDGMAGWVGVHVDGGYAPYAVLPVGNVVVLDESIDACAATVITDAVATSIHVLARRAQVEPGEHVAVIGAGGGVGAHMVQVARLLGCEVAGLDVGDHKLSLIESLGGTAARADEVLRADATPLWPDGGRPDVVVDLVGAPDTLAWAAEALGPGGRLVVVTTFHGRSLQLDPRRLVVREVAVLGSMYAGRGEVMAAAQLVGAGRVTPVIGATVPAAEVLSLHEQLATGELVGRGAITW